MDFENNLKNNNRLVLISNGEPYTHKIKKEKTICEKLTGGLTTGLDPLMQEDKGLWIAWGRNEDDFKVIDQENKIKVPNKKGYTLKRINLSEEEKNGFYYGFSNEVLWPICHSFISKANFNPYYWKMYQQVNKKYSKAALEEIQDNDLIWVHDYHLTLVPKMIKNQKKNARIGFFWHIPWPAWESFGSIPWKRKILKGMLASDFIGFHTTELVNNFLKCARKIGARINRENNYIYLDNHKTKVKAIPLGIDFNSFNKAKNNKYIQKISNEIKNNYNCEYLIFGVDRLDYTKGILQRLQAIDQLLEKYPRYRGKVTLVQQVAPSRTKVKEYKEIREKINQTIADINGRYQNDTWEPIKYFWKSVPQDELIPYFMAADIALITPLIDGMNLVAKEYIATQDEGVLILSEFAGAAEELTTALKVNPYHTEEVAKTIHKSLNMPVSEKKQRFKKLENNVKRHDIHWWRETFLQEWMEIYE